MILTFKNTLLGSNKNMGPFQMLKSNLNVLTLNDLQYLTSHLL